MKYEPIFQTYSYIAFCKNLLRVDIHLLRLPLSYFYSYIHQFYYPYIVLILRVRIGARVKRRFLSFMNIRYLISGNIFGLSGSRINAYLF